MEVSKAKILEYTVDIVKATVSGRERLASADGIKEYIHAVHDALTELNEGEKA